MTTSTRSSRTQNISYADLMKPDEDWRNLPDAVERRRIQNRLAQRAYRRNMRDRTKEVEQLKKQLQKLQETNGHEDQTHTPPPDRETTNDNNASKTEETSPSQNFEAVPTAPTASYWMGGYLQVWPQNPEHHQLNGPALQPGDENHHNFHTSSPCPPIPISNDFPPPQGVLTQPPMAPDALTISAPLPRPPRARPEPLILQNSNNPTFLKARCPSPPLSPWTGEDFQGQAMSASNSPLPFEPGAHGHLVSFLPPSFNMNNQHDDYHLPKSAPPFCSNDEIGRTAAYDTPPNSATSAIWTTCDGLPVPSRPSSASTFQSHMSNGEQLPMPLLETNATILHLAVVGGHIDTLRLLLQRFGVSVNQRDHAGYTPLQRAVLNGRTDIVALLLEHGADASGSDEPMMKQECQEMGPGQ